MITTVADFIEELKKRGMELIKDNEYVDHPTLIGDMYEGLTSHLLNSAVFAGLDLKIVNGKIRNAKNELTSQIDCMIVEGDGEEIPFTNSHVYHFSQVIAVIEVKKNLFSGEIDSSFSNLKTVQDVSLEPEKDGDIYIINALRDSWKAMLRTELPEREELGTYSEEHQLIYHTLFMEAYFPVRIVIGYFGFKTEYSLREGFSNFIEDKAKQGTTRGYGIGSFPSLIICGNNTIIKNNGMPYGMSFLDEEFYWPICVTSNETPMIHSLEVIWTRLSYKYRISSSIFGDDFDCTTTHRFIDCKIAKDNKGTIGWAYNYNRFSDKLLNKPKSEIKRWQPAFLTQAQFQIIYLLIAGEEINFTTDEGLISLAISDGISSDDFVKGLIKTGLIYKRNLNIYLLTDECKLTILADGRFCGGENKNREFDTWLIKYISENENK